MTHSLRLTPLTAQTLDSTPQCRHGFFSKQGGVSTGIYTGLNCGPGSDDNARNVRANRAAVARHLGVVPEHLLNLYQIHSANVVIADKPWALGQAPQADALVTRQSGLALSILTADCTPVLFCDPSARVIAAAHAGWKGALSGVIAATIDTMESLGARRGNITAAIGPCITQPNYEVGPEFLSTFAAADPDFARFFTASPKPGSDRLHFDLPGFVEHRLAAAGIASIDNKAVCTYAHSDTYFSYRKSTHRNEPDYGRNISAIALI